MKRLISALLIMALILTVLLTSCNGSNEKENDVSETLASTATADDNSVAFPLSVNVGTSELFV